MARAGRKRKQGNRHPSGQLVRTQRVDRGTAELQMHRLARIGAVQPPSMEVWLSKGAEAAISGTMPTRKSRKAGAPTGVPAVKMIDTTETIDPIGRAWAVGLLDQDPCGYDALSLRDAGRRFAALYWRKLPSPSPVSGLYSKMVSGLVDELPAGIDRDKIIEDADARDMRQEAALNRMLAGLRRLGHDVRKATDELVLDPFADIGPAWLDRLIALKTSAQKDLQTAIAGKRTISELRFLGDGEDDRLADARDWWWFADGLRSELVTLSKALSGLRLIHDGGRLTID